MFRFLLSGAVIAMLSAPSWAADVASDALNSTEMSNAEIIVTAKRLDAARESIKPSLGATTYSLTNANIQNLPGGDNQSLNDILLQMPGVAQDGFGQFHVRDDHNGLQYRINGAILPEGIAVFGQTLSPRLVDKLDLITGALPAQYGLRSAGIVDITTKTGLKNGATLNLYGGTAQTIQPSIELSGHSAASNWFASANYIQNDRGIENVNANISAVHDQTKQVNGFAYFDHLLSSDDRISVMAGYSNQHYQIPNPIGLQPDNGYLINGISAFPSAQLNENQLQTTGFGIVSLLHTAGPFTLQGNVFVRVATLDYRPDVLGEMLFNALAQAAHKRDVAIGAQIEGVYKIGAGTHTLRGGIILQHDKAQTNTLSFVLPTDANGNVPLGSAPLTIPDGSTSTMLTTSAYLQDEWKLSQRLVLNFGGRYDEYTALRDERAFSPRINLVWTPDKATTLHLGYARYFSPPRNDQVVTPTLSLYANTTGYANSALNDPALAEREHYFDIGLQQKIGRDITIGLDAYYRLFTNLLDDGQFGAPIIQSIFNYAKGRTRGVELSLNYAHGGLNAYANLALAAGQGTQINSGQFNFAPDELAYIASHYIYLDHDQRWTGSAGVSYKFRHGTLMGTYASADLVYGSGLRNTVDAVSNGAELPAYATLNASIGHKFKDAGLDVHIDVVNLTDKIYEIRDGTGVGVGAPQYGARRGVFFGVTKAI